MARKKVREYTGKRLLKVSKGRVLGSGRVWGPLAGRCTPCSYVLHQILPH